MQENQIWGVVRDAQRSKLLPQAYHLCLRITKPFKPVSTVPYALAIEGPHPASDVAGMWM